MGISVQTFFIAVPMQVGIGIPVPSDIYSDASTCIIEDITGTGLGVVTTGGDDILARNWREDFYIKQTFTNVAASSSHKSAIVYFLTKADGGSMTSKIKHITIDIIAEINGDMSGSYVEIYPLERTTNDGNTWSYNLNAIPSVSAYGVYVESGSSLQVSTVQISSRCNAFAVVLTTEASGLGENLSGYGKASIRKINVSEINKENSASLANVVCDLEDDVSAIATLLNSLS